MNSKRSKKKHRRRRKRSSIGRKISRRIRTGGGERGKAMSTTVQK